MSTKKPLTPRPKNELDALRARVKELEAAQASAKQAEARAEDKVRRQKEFSDLLINSSTGGVLAFDRDYRLTVWNPAMERISGLGKDQVLGKSALELFPFLEETGEDRHLRESLAGKSIVRKDGHYIVPETGREGFFEANYSPLLNESGEVIGGLATVHDVTERKQAEETLRKAHDELELRVRERTKKLGQTNEALQVEIAERRRAEKAVKAERQLFTEVLDQLPAYLVLLTPDYHVPFANRFFRERFGESFGKRCFEYLFQRSEPCEVCETYKVLKTTSPLQWEWTGPDGRNYHVFDYPFTDTDGSRLIMEVGLDITDSKRAQQALQEARDNLEMRVQERTEQLAQTNVQLRAEVEERRKAETALREAHEKTAWLARFPEENPNPVLRVSANGSVLYRNPASAELPEWECEVGKPLPDALLPLIGRAMTGLREIQQEIELDGRFYSVAVVPFPVQSYANVYGRDITERKRAEEALNEAYARYANILETSLSGFFVANPQGKFVEVNEALCRMLGYTRKELLTLSIADLEAVESPEEVLRHAAALREKRNDRIVSRHRRKDGSIIDVEVNATWLDVGDGQIVSFLSDITERKRTEALLRTRLNLSEQALHVSIDDLLQTALDEAERHTGSCVGYFHFVNEAQNDLTLQSWSTNTLKNMCKAEGKGLHYPISQAGVWVDCFHARAPVIHNDYAGLPHKRGLPEGHPPITRDLAVPVMRGGSVVALMGVGNKQIDYTQQDVEVLQGLANSVIDLVAKMQAEQALRESTERLSRAQEIAHLGSWELDVANNRLSWSDETYRIFGLDPQEFEATYEAFLDAVHPNDRAAVNAAYLGSVRDGKDSYEIEHRIVRKATGEVRFVYEKCEHVRDASGRIVRSVGMVHNVTQGREAEEQLRKLSYAIEQSSSTVLITDTQGRIEYVNPKFTQTTGYTSEEALGNNPRILKSGLTPPGEYDKLWQTITSGGEWRGTFQNRKKNGELYWELASISPVRDAAGNISRYVAVKEDITEIKRAEEALQESRERYRAVTQSANDAIISADSNGNIIFWNNGAQRIFGYEVLEVLGKPLTLLMPERYREAHCAKLAQLSSSGRLHPAGRTVELHGLRKDGNEFPLEISLASWETDKGHFCTGIIRDITARKQAEEEILKANRELQTLNEELGLALERADRLAIQAQAANKAKSEFIANMSHEIRTPMNGIIGMTELTLDTHLTREQREYLEMVRGSADSLLTLLNEILDFSKIESGKLDLLPEGFSLRDSLGKTLKTLGVRAQQKGLELTCDISPQVPDGLIGDPDRLRQIVINIVGNAIKFTEQGEVVVRVETESQAEAQTCLHFAVRDTGIGIPPDKRELIFSSFVQADGSLTRKYGGTGLGLTIASRLAEMMGGRIWVESEEGDGSTFHFTACFGLQKGPAAALTPRADLPSVRGLRALVVDDNATNRRVLEEMLANWQMEVAVAESGAAALAAMTRARETGKPFALLLVDAAMPGMDGFALVVQLRAGQLPAGSVIMMLASGGKRGDAERCKRLGITSYLIKPVTQSELCDAVLTALGSARAKEEQPAPATQQAEPKAGRRIKILLVEDNPVSQLLVQRVLEKWGHTVTAADDGERALAALDKDEFDMLLMDVQMPGMDGMAATAAIREREKTSGKRIPIVAMTAHVMRGDRERCIEAGMDDYISKPVHARDLRQTIERLFP